VSSTLDLSTVLNRSWLVPFSSPEPIAASSTNMMSPRKSFIFEPAIRWNRNWLTPIGQLHCVSDKGLRSISETRVP